MKRKKTLCTIAAGLFLLASCDLNQPPVFDDKDAFVAFDRLTINIPEESGSFKVPVTLVSLSGASGTAEFEVDAAASKAVEGVNFAIRNASRTLTFSKDAPTQYIELEIIDNDIFTGDLPLVLKLTTSSIDLGANATCRIIIIDNEHPLMMLFGDYSGKYLDYFDDGAEVDVDITIAKDASDPSKVWISNLDPYFASYGYVAPTYNYFYGIVNEEKTEIRIPVGQNVGYASESVTLAGFNDPDPDAGEELPSGGNIIIEILDGGAKLRIANAWGMIASDGYWALYFGDAILNKQ
ncbi:hypothetical protein FACS1894181_08480 [Bacteroidia bacterium]|nr:hypothetical protein FACS1894181_08480 [Bacteroidia bacterium]